MILQPEVSLPRIGSFKKVPQIFIWNMFATRCAEATFSYINPTLKSRYHLFHCSAFQICFSQIVVINRSECTHLQLRFGDGVLEMYITFLFPKSLYYWGTNCYPGCRYRNITGVSYICDFRGAKDCAY